MKFEAQYWLTNKSFVNGEILSFKMFTKAYCPDTSVRFDVGESPTPALYVSERWRGL